MSLPLPCQYLTKDFPPTDPTQFVGPARGAAERLRLMITCALDNGSPPLRIFYGGPSGTGKTALTYYARYLLKVHPAAVNEYNGTDLTIDRVRDMEQRLSLRHDPMFGQYRFYAVQEADRVPDVAQIKLLTLLDNLPSRTLFICTTNMDIQSMQQRMQSRFKYTKIEPPKDDEIVELLRQWDVPEYVCRMIAVGSCGNVRTAMMEAEEYMMTHSPSASNTSKKLSRHRTLDMPLDLVQPVTA